MKQRWQPGREVDEDENAHARSQYPRPAEVGARVIEIEKDQHGRRNDERRLLAEERRRERDGRNARIGRGVAAPEGDRGIHGGKAEQHERMSNDAAIQPVPKAAPGMTANNSAVARARCG